MRIDLLRDLYREGNGRPRGLDLDLRSGAEELALGILCSGESGTPYTDRLAAVCKEGEAFGGGGHINTYPFPG